MRFAFSDERRLFQRTVRELLARVCPAAAVRAAWTGDDRRAARWAELARVGLLGVTVPAEHGGGGGDALDWVLPLEEAGRAALPDPLVETAVVAAPLLAALPAAHHWLRPLADGRAVIAVGLDGPLVAHAAGCDAALLADGAALHLVSRAALAVTPRRSIDGARRLAAVAWTPRAETLLCADGAALAAAARDRGALAAAALLVGLGARMLEMAVDHVTLRRQFGQPVGAFQAVKHPLADAHVALELARPLLHHAAWALATAQPDGAVAVSMAKAAASDAAERTARAVLQAHGAIGYSFEHDLHLWMKRAWALAAAWGDAAWHRARVAVAVIDHPASDEESEHA